MSAWSKVRVHELGLTSSHIGAQRRGQKGKLFFLYSLLSLTNTLANAQTSLTQLQSSFSVITAWSSVDRGTPWENEGGTGGREEGRAGGGYCRAHKAAWIQVFFCFFSFWDAFSVLRWHFTVRAEGVYTCCWARQATERESQVLKLSKRQNKNTVGRKRREEEAREAGRGSLTEGLSHSCWCVSVFVCVWSLEGPQELTHQGPESRSKFTSTWLSSQVFFVALENLAILEAGLTKLAAGSVYPPVGTSCYKTIG